MKSLKQILQISLLVGLLAACTTPAPQPDGCVGQIDPVPQGLRATENPELLKSAVGEKGKGGLCKGQVFTSESPIRVYRVWNAEKSYTAFGRWWSFDAPGNDREAYRKANDICPEWSALDIVHHCWLKPNVEIVVGPGQSAHCDHETLPPSATNQVFIPNDTQKGIKLVENCSPSLPWPENK